MKTSNVLASMLFGSLAAAAPMNKRALVTVTSTVVQTEITYTTIYAGEGAAAASTSSAAAFYEETSTQASVPVAPTTVQTSAVAAPTTTIQTSAVAAPTTIKTSPVAAPTTIKTSAVAAPSTVQTSAAPTTKTTAPVVVPTSTYVPTTTAAPAQPTTTAVAADATSAAAAAPTTASSTGSGEVHSGGSMTLNEFGGNLGSCGKPIADTEMTVALASDLYGASTYDVATGNPTNKWCGQKVAITYKGKTTTATIMDKCAGCTNGGFDMTPSLWEAVTGTSVGDRITGMTWANV